MAAFTERPLRKVREETADERNGYKRKKRKAQV